MYFPNLEELSFRFVLALPNASKMSFDWSKTFFARSISACPETLVTAAMYLQVLISHLDAHEELPILGPAIAQWIRLRLPAPGSSPKHTIYAFYIQTFYCICHCVGKGMKINKKRPGLAHLKKESSI